MSSLINALLQCNEAVELGYRLHEKMHVSRHPDPIKQAAARKAIHKCSYHSRFSRVLLSNNTGKRTNSISGS